MKPKISYHGEGFAEKLKSEKTWVRKFPGNSPEKINDITFSRRVGSIIGSGGGISTGDLERIIGTNDLLPINYLDRGMQASKSVCRIFVADDVNTIQSDPAWGTGFLIGPNLLITNHHVIGTAEAAAGSFAEFEYETDARGTLKKSKRFALRPDIAFVTNPYTSGMEGSSTIGLDYTIVGISPISDDGVTQLSSFGMLRLNAGTSKVMEREYVTIIQHPEGGLKQLSVRENEVLKIGDRDDAFKNSFIWYVSDTAPGSSGSPVFSDNWQVVALHHSSVPETKIEEGVIYAKLADNSWVPWSELRYNHELVYMANEGIRISSIIEDVKKQYNSAPAESSVKTDIVRQLIEDATGIRPFAGTIEKVSIVPGDSFNADALAEAERRAAKINVHPASFFDGCKGYDALFLGMPVALPKLNTALDFGEPAKIIGTNDTVLNYTHFSLEVNKDRKLAYYTAVNIDGQQWNNLKREGDKWFFDGRLELTAQAGEELYGNEPGGNYFDRGHLVRRLDPVWGTEDIANRANNDTFHFTNCSPQYWGFNQGKDLWQGLENHILYNTDQEELKATVFTGPVFRKNDKMHRGVPIPQEFWKVVTVVDSVGKLYSAAFIVSQSKWATNIPFEVWPTNDFNNFQVTVKKIQEVTGLLFDEQVLNSDVRFGATNKKPLKSLNDLEMIKRK